MGNKFYAAVLVLFLSYSEVTTATPCLFALQESDKVGRLLIDSSPDYVDFIASRIQTQDQIALFPADYFISVLTQVGTSPENAQYLLQKIGEMMGVVEKYKHLESSQYFVNFQILAAATEYLKLDSDSKKSAANDHLHFCSSKNCEFAPEAGPNRTAVFDMFPLNFEVRDLVANPISHDATKGVGKDTRLLRREVVFLKAPGDFVQNDAEEAAEWLGQFFAEVTMAAVNHLFSENLGTTYYYRKYIYSEDGKIVVDQNFHRLLMLSTSRGAYFAAKSLAYALLYGEDAGRNASDKIKLGVQLKALSDLNNYAGEKIVKNHMISTFNILTVGNNMVKAISDPAPKN